MADKKEPLNIEELKAKYGKLYTVATTIMEGDDDSRELRYIFKRPTAASYDRFVKMAANSPTKASKAFVLDAIIEEQAPQLEADLEEYPALVMTINDRLFELLGLSKDINLKKL